MRLGRDRCQFARARVGTCHGVAGRAQEAGDEEGRAVSSLWPVEPGEQYGRAECTKLVKANALRMDHGGAA